MTEHVLPAEFGSLHTYQWNLPDVAVNPEGEVFISASDRSPYPERESVIRAAKRNTIEEEPVRTGVLLQVHETITARQRQLAREIGLIECMAEKNTLAAGNTSRLRNWFLSTFVRLSRGTHSKQATRQRIPATMGRLGSNHTVILSVPASPPRSDCRLQGSHRQDQSATHCFTLACVFSEPGVGVL